MASGQNEIQWSPRVAKSKLRCLYESDAKGMLDEDLLDEVGVGLLLRCQDILTIYQAKQGRVKCPSCDRHRRETMIERGPKSKGDPRDQTIQCPECGWQITWGAFSASYKRKQLNPGGAVDVFAGYVKAYKGVCTPMEKMLAIDRLIHEFHRSLVHSTSRPVGVNLIQGKLTDVVEFLDRLTYGDHLPENVRVSRAAWREEMKTTFWGDLVSTVEDWEDG